MNAARAGWTAGGALLAGYAADLGLGDPRSHHPVAGFGRAAAALEQYGWRPRRRTGVSHALVLVLGSAVAGRLAESLAARIRGGRTTLTALVVWITLGGRSLVREGCSVAGLVQARDVEGARRRIPALVGRDPSSLDGDGLCRAAVESVAENTADAVVAPLLWCAVSGPGGAVAYRAANTLDAMWGHRSARYERYGWAAARLDDLLTWPAARLGALLAVALSPLVGGRPSAAWRALRRDGGAHPSPNAGRLEASFAGALGVRLGGRNVYGERVELRPHLGEGAEPGPGDVLRAARLSRAVGTSSALLAALVAGTVAR
jgi:adenosylcobinamide-phosphate synthase